MRDLKELNWRSRGPKLPTTVLDAATLRIGAPLPESYRLFLSQMDGGRVGRGAFRALGRDWRIAGFYCFADAAALMERLKKAARIPTNFLPVAYVDENKQQDTPLVFLELNGEGRVYVKGSARTRWEDPNAVAELGASFAEFVEMLGDAPAEPLPLPVEEPAPAAEAPKPAVAAPAAVAHNGARPKLAARPAAPVKAAPAPVAPARPAAPKAAKARPAAKAAKKKAKARPTAKARSTAKAKPKAAAKRPAAKGAKKKAATKRVAVKAGRGRR